MKFPKYFISKSGNKKKKHITQISVDGSPRYVCNPNSPNNTYQLKDCLKDWTPIY